jgi:uncharacterized lipoprotein YddW (UPF0748 family)
VNFAAMGTDCGSIALQQMNSAAMKHYISDMVRKFDEAGVNAVIFQIRPKPMLSSGRSWSREPVPDRRTGKEPDDPTFDPLAFIIEECHKRGMSFTPG